MTSIAPNTEDLTNDEKISKLTNEAIEKILEFVLAHRTMEFIYDETMNNWREFEDSISHGYPIKAAGIIATLDNLDKLREGSFYHEDELVYPGEATDALNNIYLKQASAAYVFTILELYGDGVSNITQPGHLPDFRSWHNSIKGTINLSDNTALEAARKKFGEPFNINENSIPNFIIAYLVEIKNLRNKYMHKGHAAIDFEDFTKKALALICFIHLTLVPTDTSLALYPYEDYYEKYSTPKKKKPIKENDCQKIGN